MPQYSSLVTVEGQAKIAASIGGLGDIAITHIAVGDGNNSEVVPVETMVALKREVWRGGVQNIARDTLTPTQLVVSGTVPASAGPFSIREVGLFTSDGKLFAIASYPETAKPSTAQGAVSDIVIDFYVAVDTQAALSIVVNTSDQVNVTQMLRLPFIAVDGHLVNAPPASPAVGATYVIGNNPTGAWASHNYKVAQWTGSVWTVANAAERTVVGDKASADFYRRTATGWASWSASETVPGLIRLATREESRNGTRTDVAVTPAGLQAGKLKRTRVKFANPGSINWTVPEGITAILVKVWGAGGGGGFGSSGGGVASGGSGGGYSEIVFEVTPGQAVTGTVGGGGSGSGLASSHGAPGGDTSATYSGGTITGKGGPGGQTSAGGSANSPGVAIGQYGEVNLTGGQGGFGFKADGSTYSGNGGAAPLGGLGGVGGGGAPSGGSAPGGGGGGSGGGFAGGAGAHGAIWIEY